MEATYHLNPGELNETFLKAMQLLFQDRRVKVTVEVDAETELDETDAIRTNKPYHEKLMRSIQQAEAGLIEEVNLDQYLSDASVDVH
ncbi:MAG: hypothetical protein EAZ89_20390 [Bacteroidetes bacterium]|nr:MAG: hypothetical protein EAZ91_13330 [Cytophagales bacterium]TAE46276.1 MAG: hypothetical protein EAZ89_20390 [Bacteroidota bacterium]